MIEQVRGLIVTAARRIGGCDSDVDDAVQEISLHLLVKTVPAFDPARASWPALAAISCANKARDIARRRARQSRKADTQRLPENVPSAGEDLSIDRLAVDIRRNPQRYFPHMKPALVAAALDPTGPAAMGLSRSIINQARCRVAKRLRELV